MVLSRRAARIEVAFQIMEDPYVLVDIGSLVLSGVSFVHRGDLFDSNLAGVC